MSRRVKQYMVQEMAERFSDLEDCGCVLVHYQGLGANEAAEVRGKLNEQNADMMVIRNNLFKIALEELGLAELKNAVDGPTAVVTGEDPVGAAKAVDEAQEETPQLDVLGGYAEGQVLAAEEVEKLAELPDRETLLSQVLAGISAPARRLVNCLNSPALRLASVLREIRDKKEDEEG